MKIPNMPYHGLLCTWLAVILVCGHEALVVCTLALPLARSASTLWIDRQVVRGSLYESRQNLCGGIAKLQELVFKMLHVCKFYAAREADASYVKARLQGASRVNLFFRRSSLIMAWPVYKFDAVTYTFYSIAVLTTTLRVFVRTRILRAFWLDDILAIIATVCDDSFILYHN